MRAACFAVPAVPRSRARPEGRGRLARRRGGPAANASRRDVETDEEASKQSLCDDRPVDGATLSRRAGLVIGAAALTQAVPVSNSAVWPSPASAKLALEYDGVPAVAYAFDATLEVVALRGSVPSQWEAEFNRTLRKGKVTLSTAATPKDLYESLKRASTAANVGALQGNMPRPGVPGPGGFAAPTPAQLAANSASGTKKTKSKKADGKSKTAKADVVSLGDEFLAGAVANGLVLPLDASVASQAWYDRLPTRFRRLASRNPDGSPATPPTPTPSAARRGSSALAVASSQSTASVVYGVPYRWGATLIAYRSDKLPVSLINTIDENGGIDWTDLWRPEFKRRVAFGGGPRALLTASLRAEGLSANDPRGLGASSAVTTRLNALRDDQLLTTDDAQYAQALANGDAWAVVGPSDDLLALARRSSLITVAVPRSGTSLFADVWCVPATAPYKSGGVSPLVNQWFDYTTSPARVNLRSGLKGGVSTVAFDGARVDYGAGRLDGPAGGFVGEVFHGEESSFDLSAFIRDALAGGDAKPGDLTRGGMPPDETWARSEFLEPLSPRAREGYNALLNEWRATKR